jgi:hypothetical protein
MVKENKIYTIKEAEGYFKNLKVKKPNKIALEDAILLLLTCLDQKGKVIISRLLLMKEVFLFYEEVLRPMGLSKGAGKDAGFFAYKYGPYSADVNVALSALAISGKIKISNYYKTLNDSSIKNLGSNENIIIKDFNKKFLTYFETDHDFDEILLKYSNILSKKKISKTKFKKELATRKHSWDQSGYKGILKYVYERPKFRKYIKNSVLLQHKVRDINGGVIREDYSGGFK